ncbi:M56/M15 family metallopeptidase [Reichenbachiella sp. MALMAid0571]|uniref:M56/M15 family metallopeptidase n=1 Tax=Reichenbachiella sp. MALMAid0571 TaxID=3143939 RepID=UPI0032DFCF46
MITYIIESGVCMSISLICYVIFFNNDKYLYFNRGYLLFTLILSLSLPFIDIETEYSYFDSSHFNIVADNEVVAETAEVTTKKSNEESTAITPFYQFYTIVLMAYFIGVLLMFFRYFKNLIDLSKLIAASERVDRGSHKLILTKKLIGPFSFMSFIFVNKNQFENDEINETIWTHELVHARQYHTIDILFVELLLVVFYFNPLVWVYRLFLKSNHEYIADEKVIKKHSDLEKYANYLIQFAHSKNTMLFECSFNYSSIKNRLMMLSKSKNSKLLFANKVALASLLVLATAAMLAFKNIEKPQMNENGNDQFTVVIDFGHGGKDPGTLSDDNSVTETEIINSIGSIIKEIQTQSNFVYTRGNEFVSLKDRTDLANSVNADLLVSLHVGSQVGSKSNGVEIFYSESNFASEQSKTIAQQFAEKLKFRRGSRSNSVKTANFMVLKESKCPSVLLSLGFLSNQKDLDYLKSYENQKNLAKQIVDILEQVKG